jgi:hypothetical protein
MKRARVSPFCVLKYVSFTIITEPPNFCIAAWNDDNVIVDGSKKTNPKIEFVLLYIII